MWSRLLAKSPSQTPSRKEVREAARPTVKKFVVPVWNKPIYIRKLSVRDAYEIRRTTPKGDDEKSLEQLTDEVEDFIAKHIAFCVLDENYERIFTVEEVMQFDVEIYNVLSLEVLAYNKINVNIEAVKEELKKVQA